MDPPPIALLGDDVQHQPGYVSPCRKRYTVALHFCINLLNYMDRYTVAGALPLLLTSADSGLDRDVSSAEGGLLASSFIVVYMACGPLFGYFADRGSRKLVVGVGLVLWAGASAASSFAQTYWQLLAARACIGIGEASYAVVSPVLIADLYGPEERTRALAVFYLAIPVGSAAGFIAGGVVGETFGWRWAFRIVPCLLALCLGGLTLAHEPEPGASEEGGHGHGAAPAGSKAAGGSQQQQQQQQQSGIRAWCSDVAAIFRIPSFALSTLGAAFAFFSVGALSQWMPTFVAAGTDEAEDVEPVSLSVASFTFGAITCVSGVLGTLSGAFLTERLVKKDWGGADSVVCAIGCAAAVPFILLGLLLTPAQEWLPFTIPNPRFATSWVCIALGEWALCFYWSPLAALLMKVVPVRQRATAEGVQLLVSHALGDAASPTVCGLLIDLLEKTYSNGRSLQMALCLTAPFQIMAAVLFFSAGRYQKEDCERAAAGGLRERLL